MPSSSLPEHCVAWFRRRPVAILGALPAAVATVAAGAIAVLAVAGMASHLDVPGTQWFDLDAERRVAAVFSAVLLLLAAASAVLVYRADPAGTAVLPVGGFLGLMAVDELAAVHESLEAAIGVDWQLLYLPVFAMAGVCFILALRRYWASTPFRVTWVAGAACWASSQVLERIQWDGDVQQPGYARMMITEELLEMTGSALFLVALLVVASAASRTPRGADRVA